MIKINIIVLSLILFLNSCGFTPVYLNNKSVNFSIEQVNYTGDRELNNFLKANLSKYKDTKSNNKIFVDIKSRYEKNILSKDATGKATNYQLVVETIFSIQPTNKKIIITEKKIMDSIDDKFEETKRERSIKQSFASLISNKFISKLID